MLRRPGGLIHHAIPPTGPNSIEAFPEMFSLRRARAAFSHWNGMGILELFRSGGPRFRVERKSVGDEGPWRRGDGDIGADRNASHQSRPFCLARSEEHTSELQSRLHL